MQLRSLHLENYRKYRDQFIEFPTGIIGIVGKNGTGKSSLIEAIGWCLYGNHAARTTADKIRTTGAIGGNCRVTLEFKLDSDAIKIVRELRGDGASGHASVFLNGCDDAQVRGTKEVTNYIVERTGMDYVAFFTSVFAKQKELDSLSNHTSGQRKKILMRLLRINKIDDVIDSIRADIKAGRGIISTLEEGLKDIDTLKEECDAAFKEKKRIDARINLYKKKIAEMEEIETKAKSSFKAHKAKYEEYNSVERKRIKIIEQAKSKKEEIKRINGEIKDARASEKLLQQMAPQLEEYESVERRKTDLDEAFSKFGEMTELKRQRNILKSKISKAARSITVHEKKITSMKGLDSQLEIHKAKFLKIQTTVDTFTVSVNTVDAQIVEFKKQKLEYTAKLSKIKKLGKDGTCPTCDRPLQNHYPLVSRQYEDKISALTNSIHTKQSEKKKLESSLHTSQDHHTTTNKKIDDIKESIRKRQSLQEDLEKDNKEHVGLLREESDIDKKLDNFLGLEYDPVMHKSVTKLYKKLLKVKDTSIKLATKTERIPALTKQHTQYSKTINELKEQMSAENEHLKKIGYDKIGHTKSEKALEAATSKLASAREEQIRLEGKVNETKLLLEQITEDIREEEEKRVRLDLERKKIDSRSKLEQVMGDFRLDLISRIKPMLSQRASEMIAKITQGRYSRIELDDNYDMQIEDEGMSFATDRFSGGEVDLASLCLRVAISQELAERAGGTQPSFIALDEIFGSQDEDRKRNILDTLHELSNRFSQILVITHIEDVREALPYAFVVKEDSENMSSIRIEGSIQSVT